MMMVVVHVRVQGYEGILQTPKDFGFSKYQERE